MKRLPAERAIIFAGVLGGLTRAQINDLLPTNAARLPDSSYEMLRNTYFGSMIVGINQGISNGPNDFGDMIFHPKPMGDL